MVQHHVQRLSILNEPPNFLEGPTLLHELVPRSSNVSAIEFLEYGTKMRKFSYHTLHALSDILAQRIIELTATMENASAVIPVLLPQCPELYIALLAVLKAGKAFCPLNLDVPDERLKFILSDVAANLLITTTGLSNRLSSIGKVGLICVDQELRQGEEKAVTASPQTSSTDLAYVLYTSGSTGLPKAVSVSHRAVTQSLLAHDRHLPGFTRFLQFAAPTFDVSIFEIFFPWFRGRTLVSSSRARMLENLPGVIKILEADAAELTPTVVGNLLQGRASVPGLTLLLTIGEMLTQHVVSEFGDSTMRKGILWAMYGPTETAIHCTLQARFSAHSSTGNIGYPLDTVSTFILAPSQDASEGAGALILPWGESGELALGGYQIAEGYLNRPELTAAAFIDHPKFGRLYRTGDRAKFHKDGAIECLGRMFSGQVKLRGQRVELGEIEQVVMKVKGCRVAVATIIKDTLVAFCASSSQTTSRTEVLEICKKWLPSFMIPSDVLVVSSMPQLPSGKIDRQALEKRYLDSLQRQGHDIPTDDPEALAVLHLAEKVLGQGLSLESNLAAAGLDSLRAIRVASSLRAQGYDVSAVALLSVRTLQDLITACKQNLVLNEHANSTSRLSLDDIDNSTIGPAFEESDIDVILPCTPLQEAMLTETLSRPSAYCNWVELELTVIRSHDELFGAIAQLAKHNRILRSGFCSSTANTQAFVQITWRELDQAQFGIVSNFQRSYSLDTSHALLRPFRVQVQTRSDGQRILVQLHHALYDGWSLDLLLADFNKILRGSGPTTRPQFEDVSQYYIERQQTSAPAENTRYWAKLLRDYVPTSLVNYNGETKTAESTQSYRARSSVDLGHLSDRARSLAINPQVFFQAAVGYILSLYTGSPDVIFGNITSGRTIPVTGIEDIMGPCIASLPCRLDFRAYSCVQEVLEQVQRLNREGLHHCALPLRDIARAANVQPGTRLFDTLFVWQQSLVSEISSFPAVKIIDGADELEFKLTLEFEPRDGFIAFRATFDPSSIPREQIVHLAQQIDEVVEKLLGDVSCTVADIGRCFTQTSLSVANADYRRNSDNISLSHAVETWAEVVPDKEAIIFGQVHGGAMIVRNTLTYSDLNQRANQLAHLLSKHGVGQDRLVCIMMEKSVDLYVAILAVLKLGSGYLPLVPDTPVERVDAILKDAQVMVCLGDSNSSEILQQVFSSTIIDLCATDLSTLPRHNLDTLYNGSHIAYAVFTSGSTGTPKGVLVTQRNLMSNLKFLAGLYPASKNSRMLQSCSQAFDVSVFEIFYAWHVGMTLCTAAKEDMFRDFEASINSLKATHLSLTPTVAALVDPDNVPGVKLLVTAGEALTEHVRRQWAGRGLYQGYGPSETTNICTVRPSVTSTDLINNIGSPFDNTSAFVLDPDSNTILPRGAVGELCFGGEQVFRGYLNRPELNAAKLIEIAPYGRVYRSGDMGRLLPDDCILSAGRSDDQVKIRGQRVELGEITSIILDDSAVTDCITLLLSTPNHVKVLLAFWVPQSGIHERFATLDSSSFKPAVQRIFGSLRRLLPVYMVPSYLIPISRLPMTAQAKIDKRLLQATFANLSDDDLTRAAPAHTTNGETNGDANGTTTSPSTWQKSVAEVLAKVLEIKVEGIRQTSSFFNLGLDSISAIRFCHHLRRSDLGDFTVAEVLKNPTIAYLDDMRVDRHPSKSTQRTAEENLESVFVEEKSQILSIFSETGLGVEKINPCTPLQEAMLASSMSSKGTYSNTMIFNVTGDVLRLQASWKLAQSRHEILRTAFTPSDHATFAFAQVVLRDPELRWDQLETLRDVQSHMDTVLADLLVSHRPPLCLAIYEADLSTNLIFSCHHALYDGIAIENLLHEVQLAYLGQSLPSTISYDRYLQHIVSQNSADADKFWSSRFTNFEPTYFPDLTGRVHKEPGVSKSTTHNLQLPLNELRTASRHTSVSVLSMVQAAWAKLLHYYTGEHDLCFGNVVSGRTLSEEGMDQLVAPCFNTLPVRAHFDFSSSNLGLVQLLHNSNVESLAYQLTALRRIQGAALKDGGRLFDTLVILQQPTKPLNDSIWTLVDDMGEMDLPVVCEIHQDEKLDRIKLTLHYNTSLMSERDAQVVARTFDNSLWALTQHYDAAANNPIGMPESLRAESNMGFTRLQPDTMPLCNGARTDVDTSNLLHKGFEQNAFSRRRDNIALDFLHADGRRTHWSYHELNLIANGVAYRLMHRGVGLEDIVPLHMPKSPIYYASILGVLKAGAAFAPVHPDLPEARKKLMLQELNPKVVLYTEFLPVCSRQMSIIPLNVADLEKPSLDSCEDPHVEGLVGSNLAYCLYTSGSTGVPKAVSMEHQSPIQTLESSRSLVPWTSSSRILQYAAITFDMCYYDCFMAWTFGFTLCAAEQHVMFDNLLHVVNELDVTLLDLTPSVALSLSRAQVPSVQWLYCIGEAMSGEVAKEWSGACVNSYGPTEAAFCTTMFPVSNDIKTSVIGQPYPSTSFAVFSTQGEQPLPKLSVGELYIGGAQLARGYLGRPELTAERFNTRCGQRFYKTGDVVRMLTDGTFEFIGRTDDQVKIRGLRVELGEISQVLQRCDMRIKSAVVQILKKDAAAKEQLVAFLATGHTLEDDDESDLRKEAIKAAKSHLPGYMVPQFYLLVDRIPKSMAGKIDKKVLAEIFKSATATNGISEGPNNDHKWTRIETHIRGVLSRLSDTPVEDIYPETSIYQLGLDSISAVQISAALRRYGYEASASEVLRFNSCINLAENLEIRPQTASPSVEQFDFHAFDRKHRAAVLRQCGLDSQSIDAIRPCTPLQQGMVSQFLVTNGSLYYNYLRLKLNEPGIDVQRLEGAWAKTIARHAILRTGFAQVKDRDCSFAMVQYTSDSLTIPWSEGSDPDPKVAARRLGQLQQEALAKLHQPMWDLHIITHNENIFLDICMFHALFDAQSLQVVFDDVLAFYNNQDRTKKASLEPALGEILQLTNSQSTQTEQFWSGLKCKTVPSRFPNMAPLRYEPMLPAVLTRLSSMSITQIENGCRVANTTLQAAGIASWSSILAAYTGEPNVTIGVVLSGRLSDASDDAVFPCINTVPFPCAVTSDRSGTLKSVTALNAEMHQHQFTPLNKIQRLMGSPNEPLFDSLFALQKTSGRSQQNELWTIVKESATTEHPISIELELRHEILEYRLTYLPHIIPSEQAGLILEQLDHVMKGFLKANDASEHETIVSQSLYSITPAKESSLPSEAKLLHELVEITADTHPDRTAFEFASSIHDEKLVSTPWTYQEVDAEGNRIAHLLLTYNVQQGGLVGVCFDKCPEASFAMLGILKAGCAFVAIDPSAPSARQAFIVEDSGAQVVLSMAAQSAKFKESIKVPVLNLDTVTTRHLSTVRPQLSRAVEPQDRSYCLYTSGTTGTPKGCELTHENAVQALIAFQRLFAGHWDGTSRWLQFASFHFDVSVLEQYWSWSVGICVVSAPRDLIFEDIANSVRTLNITHIDLTPSLAQILHPDDVPSLCKGVFITGGESLKQEILDVWGPKGVIYNGYGPTEATIGCTMYPRVPANGKPSNIGPQFDNVGSYVLQPGTDVPVLRGGVGELCVSGKLVGRGYLNRPELTKERFAHLSRFDERVYRTGDLVRVLHDGTFDFLGRADDQVKLRGQRLEIGEINSVIRQSRKDFTDVATLVLKHPHHQKEQLISFVVIGNRSPCEVSVLSLEGARLGEARDACHNKLPPYMIPTHFVPLASMPLNINNKADGKQLKQIFESLSSSDLQKLSTVPVETQSWTKQEGLLRRVFSQALGVREDAIDKNSSFYELGMDSISVIGVSRALKDAGFVKASAITILKHASIGRLAKVLSSSDSSEEHDVSLLSAQQAISATQHRYRRIVAHSLGVDSQAIEALAPCTPLQQGMIARYLDSEDGLYFNAFTFELSLAADVSRLREAWDGVFQSTQILRTTFVNTEDGYVQAVLRKTPLPWYQHFTEHPSTANQINEARKSWLASNLAELRSPFEVHVISTTEEQLLVVHIFHGLYDGNSIELLFEEVRRRYASEKADDIQVPTFHDALPYGPLRIVKGASKFWQSHLTNSASRPLSSLTKEPIQGTVVVTRDLDLNPDYDSIRRKLNVTAQAISQACWMHVLQEYVGVPITLGMVVSGRSIELEHADQVIGPMFNTIPFSQRTQIGDNWASLISRAHDFNTAALPYQHTPLSDIMKWCKRSPNHPLFETLFVYHVSQIDQSQWRRNKAWALRDGEAIADYPLAIEIEQRSRDKFSLTLVAEGRISNEKTLTKLLNRFEKALEDALAGPTAVVETSITIDENNTEDLAALYEVTSEIHGTQVFDWTDDAIAIREAIANLADVEMQKVNETTSIFELGLDSIDAIKLSSRLKKRGLYLPVSGIMRGLTVQSMVNNIKATHVNGTESQVKDVLARHKNELRNCIQSQEVDMSIVENILPLTPLQEAMVAEMIDSDYTRYFNFDVAELAADTDIDRLCNAWRTVIASTPILRTAFVEVEDPKLDAAYAQVVVKEGFFKPVERQQHDSTRQPDFPAIFERLRRVVVHSKALEPPIKITLLEMPGRTYQILSIAHALYDGWSLGLLHDAVNSAYMRRYSPAPDYEATLANIVAGSGADAEAFWKDYLTGARPSLLARRHLDFAATEKVHRKEMSSGVSLPDITAFAKNRKVSLQNLGQTIFAMTLASHVGSLDVTFGCVLSGRDDDERSQLLFPTMNTVAVRTVVHGSRVQLLQYVQDNFNNIKQWQHYPLRKASVLAGCRGKLFDCLFVYQKNAQQGSSSEMELYRSIESQSDVEYPICVEMEVVNNTLVWRCAVKEEVLNLEGAQLLLKTLDKALHNIIQSPESPTIDSTLQGTSLCGLPAFRERSTDVLNSSMSEKQTSHPVNGPLSETALQIQKALASVAQVPKTEIGRDMSIFHIGLDSISAIKVSSTLRRQGIILSVGEMLTAGSVEKMAVVVDKRTKSATNVPKDSDTIIRQALRGLDQNHILQQAGVEASQVDRILPLTAGQLYMVSMWLNTKGANFYPEFVYNLKGDLSFVTLQKSWQDLTAVNPILRTRIITTGQTGLPYIQVVLKEANASLTNITGQDDATTAHTMTEVAKQQPWAHIFAARADSGWTLRLKIHHAFYDGVSLPLLTQQLQSYCNGTAPSSPTSGFNDYIAAVYPKSAASQRQAFWTSYLSGLKPQHSTEAKPAPTSKIEIFKPGLLQTASLEQITRQNGISTQALFLAAYARLYAAEQSQGDDVVIGVYLANRGLPIENLPSAPVPTVNLLPLRVRQVSTTPIEEVARQVQDDLRLISEPIIAASSLAEVAEWTLVKIDTFVNFLSLHPGDEKSGQPDEVKIEQVYGWMEAVSRVTEMKGADGDVPIELRVKRVNEVYLHAVDVEATVQDGRLDVGIFAPTEMMSLNEGEQLIEGLRAELENLG
ncbi:nonribosomal peptide synthetase 2 [Didymella exigua CBS 183.55]|uniref:Nonribosomal peptide synthetase 2 n=1 Tax=Didymella exigua CBS 183.55 TaxID=1150837 RepID=A0A6A5S6G4_9PLEO|nr:nonribosomal peptide synthetase 2 [Didymella exigua CBS 183.55]KAF1933087.1 nonribosomal peptide synthetase 2 [Didymella exigua CBS 183.55]